MSDEIPAKAVVPAEDVLNAVLQTVKYLCECDGEFLAQMATEFYPVPEQGELVVVDASFNSEDDTITLEYGEEEEYMQELTEDVELAEFVDEPESEFECKNCGEDELDCTCEELAP